MICRSSLWPSGHWANFRNCEYTHTQTRKTHLPDMTIVVALSRVIPLRDFNVALGYNLSHPKQVLATHPRSRSPARTHRRTCTHTSRVFPPLQQMFCSAPMCHRYSVCVRVYISCIQKCFSAVQRQVQDENMWLLNRKHTLSLLQTQTCTHRLQNK